MSNVINAEWDIMSNGKNRRLEILFESINKEYASGWCNLLLWVKNCLQYVSVCSPLKYSLVYIFLFFLSTFSIFRHFVHVGVFSSQRFLLLDVLSQLTFFTFYVFSSRPFYFFWRFVLADVFYLQPFVPVGAFSIQCFIPYSVFSFEVLSVDVFYRVGVGRDFPMWGGWDGCM
jgi:hypothetical protein